MIKNEHKQLNTDQEVINIFFHQSPVMKCIIDVETKEFSDVNKKFTDFFQLNKEHVIGKTVTQLNLFIETDKWPEILEDLSKNNSIKDHILQTITNNGENKYISISANKIKIQEREAYLFALIDISQRKKHEEDLKNTNTFLNAVLDNIPNMIFVKDAKNLRFLKFNKAGENLLGLTFEDLAGKNDYDLFPKHQADFFTAKDRLVFSKKEYLDIPEEPIQTPKGERWLHTQKIPIFDEKEQALYLVGISEDITERKKQEDKIRELNKELKKKITQLQDVNKEMESFSYSVSHDLRSPLRAINGYAEMLKEDFGELIGEEGNRIINIIRANTTKMGTLIDDLLAFSRLGRKELQKTEIDMNNIVQEVIDDLKKTFEHSSAIAIQDLPKVKADYGLMYQVLYNLISNAVKFSSKKEDSRVTISWEEKGKYYLFCIKDNGAGFNMAYADKLFNVFQRLHSQEEFPGTGVGLAIVQRIIEKHGGKVWAEGELDRGATFKFSLPKK